MRYAEKSINFWVDYGDFEYKLPEEMMIDQLDTIQILNAGDLNDTDFACFMGANMSAVNLTANYNPFNYTLTITPMTG